MDFYLKESIQEKFFKGLIIILLFPALLVNLGLMPYILDEATRALVAREMMLSGNYFVPSINGEFYYNKPPLFNWILILFFKISGSNNEIVTRIPVVLSLIGFACTVYFTLKKEIGEKPAFLTAMALITCGRILFYDSFKGLIDISYSWLTYTGFWSIYYYGKKGKTLNLFVVSWLLSTAGFFMKGLPSLVFQGITLLFWLISRKQLRLLFSWQSFVGGGLFLLFTGLYFLVYSRYNSLQNYWNALWSESAGRTAVYHSFSDNILHFLVFPGEFFMHFFPWTILLIFLAGRKRLKALFSLPATRFMIIIFLANIIVYWISPVIYPRYLFMFLPLAFGAGSYAYYVSGRDSRMDRYIFKPLILIWIISLPVIMFVLPFTGRGQFHHDKLIPWLFLAFVTMIFPWFYFRFRSQRVLIFIAVLLLSRVIFNVFVLPDRLMTSRDDHWRQGALEAGRLTKGTPLFLYRDCPIHHMSSYYITAERNEMLTRWYDPPEEGIYYILPAKDISCFNEAELICVFETDLKGLKLAVVKLRNNKKPIARELPFFKDENNSKDDKNKSHDIVPS